MLRRAASTIGFLSREGMASERPPILARARRAGPAAMRHRVRKVQGSISLRAILPIGQLKPHPRMTEVSKRRAERGRGGGVFGGFSEGDVSKSVFWDINGNTVFVSTGRFIRPRLHSIPDFPSQCVVVVSCSPPVLFRSGLDEGSRSTWWALLSSMSQNPLDCLEQMIQRGLNKVRPMKPLRRAHPGRSSLTFSLISLK